MRIGEWNFMNLGLKLLIATSVLIGYFENDHLVASPKANYSQSVLDRFNLINDFYQNQFWTKGEVITYRTNEAEYEIAEIIVATESKARGYLIKQNQEYISFVDVNRLCNKVTVFDFSVNKKLVFDNINQNSDYAETSGYDFIKVISDRDSDDSQPENIFWGWSCGVEYSDDARDSCLRNCCYYIFWSSQGCSEYYCENLPEIQPFISNQIIKK